MPRQGYKSITVSEELFTKLKTLSSQRGFSIPRLLRDLVKEVGGLGNPAPQTAMALDGGVSEGEVAGKEGGAGAGPS
ncbi:MAG: hypothetical protein QXJ17_04530 [Nitrososphaeria archaeon]